MCAGNRPRGSDFGLYPTILFALSACYSLWQHLGSILAIHLNLPSTCLTVASIRTYLAFSPTFWHYVFARRTWAGTDEPLFRTTATVTKRRVTILQHAWHFPTLAYLPCHAYLLIGICSSSRSAFLFRDRWASRFLPFQTKVLRIQAHNAFPSFPFYTAALELPPVPLVRDGRPSSTGFKQPALLCFGFWTGLVKTYYALTRQRFKISPDDRVYGSGMSSMVLGRTENLVLGGRDGGWD